MNADVEFVSYEPKNANGKRARASAQTRLRDSRIIDQARQPHVEGVSSEQKNVNAERVRASTRMMPRDSGIIGQAHRPRQSVRWEIVIIE
ncbi:unnamed protein product [Ilex paraguariensis]|uniref:Uncharacterized protein n=1 Tax=Ilex paraguariensis TaxID=185542 RepID=A0ABC8RH85_9AQUA